MLLGKCFRLTELGADTFFEYSPHIGCATIHMYRGKWANESEKPKYYFVGPGCEKSVDQMMTILDERIKELSNVGSNEE